MSSHKSPVLAAATHCSSSAIANSNAMPEMIGQTIDTLLKQVEVVHGALQQLEDRISPVLVPGAPIGIEARKPDERVSPFGQALFRIQDSIRAMENRLMTIKDRVAI